METSTAHDTWCSLMTDYSSVDRLQRAFEEAKVEAQTFFYLNSQLLKDMAEAQRQASAEIAQLRSEHEPLLRDKEQLKASLADLNATHNQLMAHSLKQTDQIGDLRSTLPEAILCLLRQLLLTLPTEFDEEMTPDDTLYHFLCSSSDADATTLSFNSNLLLRSLHLDKSSTPEHPLVQAAGRLVPLITKTKRNLTSPLIRNVYDQRGLIGLRRLLQCSLRCHRCIPCAPDGVPTRQGCLEKSQLQLLFSYGEYWDYPFLNAPVDCFVALVAVPAAEPLGRIPSPPPPLFFGIVLCQLLSSLLCAMWFYHLQSFLFSAFCVDARLKMHLFGASSFAAAIQSLPGGVFRRRQHLTALPGLHLNHLSAKFPQNTLQFQLHQLLRLRHKTNSPPSCLQIIIWHDVINNSLTPHSSNYHNPLSPQALVHALSALPCDVLAIFYCQRTGSPDVFHLLRQSFFVFHPVKHLLSHRKQHNPSIVQKYRLLHLDLKIEFHIFFLLSRHLLNLTSLPKMKYRPNNKRRRTLFRRHQQQQ